MSAPASRKRFAENFRIEFASIAASVVHAVLSTTYRERELEPNYADRRAAGENVRCLYSVWHGNLWHSCRPLRHRQVCLMVSSHRDGEIGTRVARRMGYDVVRGSSTRGGARAMLDLARAARDGTGDLAIIVDGPRGPAREIKEGIVYAASRTGLPIVPIGLWVDRAWHAGSWDHHIIGKPLCRMAQSYGAEIAVPPEATRRELMEIWIPAVARGMEAAEARARAAIEGS